jgi:mRNA interferase RelE/StbE
MSYSIEIDRIALKYLKKLDKPTRTRIYNHLKILSQDPYHSELDIQRMQGTTDEYRLRIGTYRVIYFHSRFLFFYTAISSNVLGIHDVLDPNGLAQDLP